MWTAPAIVLPARGVAWVRGAYSGAELAYGLPFLALGMAKAALLGRVARRAVARVHERGPAFALSFFSTRLWAVIALMMGGGIALRASRIPRGPLGLVYLGVGLGLAVSSAVFWRALVAPAPRRGEARP